MRPNWKDPPENMVSSSHGSDEDMQTVEAGPWHRYPLSRLGLLTQGPNIIPADIIFIVKEKLHPRFRRENDDLFFVNAIPLGKVSGRSWGGQRWAVCSSLGGPRASGPALPWYLVPAFRPW